MEIDVAANAELGIACPSWCRLPALLFRALFCPFGPAPLLPSIMPAAAAVLAGGQIAAWAAAAVDVGAEPHCRGACAAAAATAGPWEPTLWASAARARVIHGRRPLLVGAWEAEPAALMLTESLTAGALATRCRGAGAVDR